MELRERFGEIDIYLFDQLLRGRIDRAAKILDAGCGGGRNLVYLLREGYEVYGVDHDRLAIEGVRRMAATLAPTLPAANFQAAKLEDIPRPDEFFDVVICNAVLHFAADDQQFRAILDGMWRKLRRGGMLYCRLASSIGIEKKVQWLTGRRGVSADGSERYLVDVDLLEKLTTELNAELLDPIKTTVVQYQRSMTTWVVRKDTKITKGG